MNKVTAKDFRELREARIKGSLNARVTELEKSMSQLEEMIDSICDLLEAHKLVDFSIVKQIHSDDVDQDTLDEYNRMNPENYGGSK
jgi:hypothetical protein